MVGSYTMTTKKQYEFDSNSLTNPPILVHQQLDTAFNLEFAATSLVKENLPGNYFPRLKHLPITLIVNKFSLPINIR